MRKEVHLEGPEYKTQKMNRRHVQWEANVRSVKLKPPRLQSFCVIFFISAVTRASL